MDRQSKYVQSLNKQYLSLQSNINKLYTITSALYQEIQEIKKFVNYEHTPDAVTDTQHFGHRANDDAMNVLNGVEDYTDALKSNRKLKVINN